MKEDKKVNFSEKGCSNRELADSWDQILKRIIALYPKTAVDHTNRNTAKFLQICMTVQNISKKSAYKYYEAKAPLTLKILHALCKEDSINPDYLLMGTFIPLNGAYDLKVAGKKVMPEIPCSNSIPETIQSNEFKCPDNLDFAEIGKRLRKVRKENRYSLEALQSTSGIDLRTLRKAEQGNIFPLKVLLLYMQFFNLTAMELLYGFQAFKKFA